jgi:N-acetylmuramoyl-L-alanine amidase
MSDGVGSGNYVVQQGDCLASIAVEHGFLWETLWDLSENAALKRVRRDPYLLLPGDHIFIPEIRVKEEARVTEARYTFVAKGVPERLRIRLTDEDDRALPNRLYTLHVDARTFHGRTDMDGKLEHPIPPNAIRGHLTVEDGKERREYALSLGYVDPIDEVSGVQTRLLNLGFYDGDVDGELDAHTRTALLLFQDRYGLAPTGECDKETRDKIKELFGC